MAGPRPRRSRRSLLRGKLHFLARRPYIEVRASEGTLRPGNDIEAGHLPRITAGVLEGLVKLFPRDETTPLWIPFVVTRTLLSPVSNGRHSGASSADHPYDTGA